MKTIILIYAILFISRISFAGDSVWVNYSSYTNHYALSFMVIDRNNTKWIGTYQDGMYRYRGNTWTKYDTSNSPLPFQLVNAMAVDSNNVLWLGNFHVVGGPAGGVVKYDGQNWTRYKMSNSGLCSDQIRYIGVEKNNAVWIGTSNGLSKFQNEQWTTYNFLDKRVMCITFEDSIKWIATTGGLARYDNVNWTYYTMSNSGLPSNYISYLSIDSSHNLWIATGFGGIAKFNYVQNQWTLYNSSNSCLENNTYCIFVDKQQGVWIGTSGPLIRLYNNTCTYFYESPVLVWPSLVSVSSDKFDNLWFCMIGGVCTYYPNGYVGVKENLVIISDYTLYQNYPNPFNASTNIRYCIKKPSEVKIVIHNIEGKEIDEMNTGRQPEGTYSIKYKADNLGSGIYFYSLIINNQITGTKKFIILK